MKNIITCRFIASALCAGLLLAFSGCGEDQNKESAAPQISAESRAEVITSDTNTHDDSQPSDEGSTEIADVNAPVIKLGDQVVVKAEYMRLCGDGMDGKYTVEDKEIISALTNALSKTRIGGVSDTRVTDDTHQITLYFENGNSETVVFEGGGYLKANNRYELGGWREVSDALDTITVKGTKSGARELDYDSSQWIERMAVVEKKIASVTSTEEYTNGDLETRYRLAMDALKELEEQGYVRKGTIFYDGYDSISFTYECCEEGVLGSIMLKEFDPEMNGIQNSTNNSQSTSFSETYMDFVGKVYKMPASEDDCKKSDFYSFIKQNDNHWKLDVLMSDDNCGGTSFLKFERQISDGIEYSSLSAVSNGNTFFDAALYFDGKDYFIRESGKQYSNKASESEKSNILSAFELEKYFGKDNNCGICSYEGKHAVYRQYVSDNMVTVLFFDDSGLLGGNIYTPNGYYDENTSLPTAADYGKLILSGKITGDLDLPTDGSLSEIPPLEAFEPDCGTAEN